MNQRSEIKGVGGVVVALFALCSLLFAPLASSATTLSFLSFSPVDGATKYTVYVTLKIGDVLPSANPQFVLPATLPTNLVLATYSVTSWNAAGESAPAFVVPGLPAPLNLALTDTPVPPTPPPIPIRLDLTTQGNWKGVYGTDGGMIANGSPATDAPYQWPAYGGNLSFDSAKLNWLWTTSTADPRALQSGVSTGRVAAAWYSLAPQLTLTIRFTDTVAHPVSVYCVDYDSTNRIQTLEFLDRTGATLARQTLTNFHNGVWLSCALAGTNQIRVTRQGAWNPVISGLFFK